MTIAQNLDAFWISKLGANRLAELPGGADGRSNLDKALNVIRHLEKDRNRLHDLIFQGFDGYFHQSVFVRTLGRKSIAEQLSQLPVGKSEGEVEWWSQEAPSSKRIRVLAGVRQHMQFLTVSDEVIRETVTIPVMVEALPSQVRVRVLTVQSTVPTWTELLGVPIRRILTPVIDTELRDQLFHRISMVAPELGEMLDLSAKAVELMKSTGSVYTYSGTFGVRKVGRTKHTAEGGRLGRRRPPLHEVMRPEFEELILSDQIRHCEIEIREEYMGLAPGTAMVFYPVEGKIVFRKMLGGGMIDEFLAHLAR